MILNANNILRFVVLLLPLINIFFNLILIKISTRPSKYLWYNYCFFYTFFVIYLFANIISKTYFEIVISILLFCIVSYIFFMLKCVESSIKINIDVIVFMPIIEEYLYRYILLRDYLVVNRWTSVIAIMISSISFGMLHYINGLKEIILKFIIGMFLSVLFIITHSIFICIIAHVFLNCIIIKLNNRR